MSATRTIIRNTAFMFAAQISLRVVNPIFNIFVIRQLGDAQFGEYSVVLTWATIFSVIGDMGIAQYMTREISRDREGAMHLFWDVTALRFILAVVASLVTIGGAILLGYSTPFILATALYCAGYFFQAIIMPLAGIIGGYERLDILSVLGVIGQIIYIVVGVITLVFVQNYVWLIAVSLINMPLIILMLVWIVRRYKITPPAFKLNPGTWWALIRAGFPFGINQVSLTLAYRFDTLVLNSYVASQVIGWYNASYNFSRSLTTFAAAFSGALVPTLAREHATNPDNVRVWYYRSFRLMIFTGLPLAVGGSLLADKLIPFIYGESFGPASIAFAILVWDTLLLMYTSLAGNIAQAIQKEGIAARIFGAEAVINLALNLIVIPHYGMIGASFTTIATEFAGAILFYRFFRREFGPGLNFLYTMRMLLAAGIMGAVVYLLHDQSMLLAIPVGMVVYILAIGLTKALTAEEQALIMKALRRIFQRVGRIAGAKT